MPKPISLEAREQLNKLYYDDKNMFGRDRLFQLAQDKDIDVSRRQLFEWLKQQENYQLFKKTNKTSNVKRTILNEPNKQIGVDIIDMQNNEVNKYKYILTAIDLFTKKAYAEPLKSKNESDVVNGMKKILDSTGPISSLRSDNGSEFVSKKFKDLLEKKEITQVFSLPYKPQSNGQIERFNGVLKNLIFKVIYDDDSIAWPDILPKLVENYNNTKHATTKKKPNDIARHEYKEVKENITKSVTPKNQRLDNLLEVGDKVRIKKTDKTNDGLKWSKKVYIIEKVYKPKKSTSTVSYFVEGKKTKYYGSDLQKVENVEREKEEEIKYEISRLEKPTIHNGIPSYIVKWKGYKERSIEPRDMLLIDAPKVVNLFEKKNNVKWVGEGFTMD